MKTWHAWAVAIGGPVASGLVMWKIVNDMQESTRLTVVEIRVEHVEKQMAGLVELVLELLQGSGVQ